MDDVEIDTADPVERCRRGRQALGLDDDSRPDEQVADPGEESSEDAEEEDGDGCRPPSVD